jgi:hypothetical protein
MHPFKKLMYSLAAPVTTPPTGLEISTSGSSDGSASGAIIIQGGSPNEVINISVDMTFVDESWSSLTFDSPITIRPLDKLHKSGTGTVQLDSSGYMQTFWHIAPTGAPAGANVTMTGRSSGLPLPSQVTVAISNQ